MYHLRTHLYAQDRVNKPFNFVNLLWQTHTKQVFKN